MAVAPLARMTVAHAIRQPMLWLTVAIGVVLMGLGWLFGMFNFDDVDRVRLLATSGIAVVTLTSVFLGVVLASQSIHDELASRTALTLFAKPVSRSDFLIGRTIGVWIAMVAVGLILIAVHALILGLTTYFGRTGIGRIDADAAFLSWPRLLSAHGLGVMQGIMIAAVAAVCAVRLPLTATILIAFTLYVGAHLAGAAGWPIFGPLPALAMFNIDDAVQFQHVDVDPWYFPLCALYAAFYSAGFLSLGAAVIARLDIP